MVVNRKSAVKNLRKGELFVTEIGVLGVQYVNHYSLIINFHNFDTSENIILSFEDFSKLANSIL